MTPATQAIMAMAAEVIMMIETLRTGISVAVIASSVATKGILRLSVHTGIIMALVDQVVEVMEQDHQRRHHLHYLPHHHHLPPAPPLLDATICTTMATPLHQHAPLSTHPTS